MEGSKKIALITGGSSGIGKATATELARKGFQVHIVGRDEARTRQAVEEIRKNSSNPDVGYLLADLSDTDSVWKLSIAVHERLPRLDVLINNAGCVNQKREFTKQKIERTFATNHLSYFLLTNLLLELLKRSAPARVINVSSDSHYSGRIDFDNLQGEKKYFIIHAYANSKLCNVLFTYELARRLNGTGISVNCLHPGVVRTDIGKKNTNFLSGSLWGLFAGVRGVTVEKGCSTSVHLAAAPELEGITGKYFDNLKEKPSAALSYDTAIAARLWEESCKLTGFK